MILAATLSVIPSLPAIGLVLLLSVDWFIGIIRACTNLIGNCVATVVIAHWEKDIDHAQAKQVLNIKIKSLIENIEVFQCSLLFNSAS